MADMTEVKPLTTIAKLDCVILFLEERKALPAEAPVIILAKNLMMDVVYAFHDEWPDSVKPYWKHFGQMARWPMRSVGRYTFVEGAKLKDNHIVFLLEKWGFPPEFLLKEFIDVVATGVDIHKVLSLIDVNTHPQEKEKLERQMTLALKNYGYRG